MDNDLLNRAKEIQRQKLLERAKSIQLAKLSGSVSPQDTGEEETSTLDKAKALGMQGLKYAGQGLDYLGGNVRTGGSYPFVKKVTAQDVLNALKGNPLTGDQILEKAGMSKGKSLSDIIPGYGNPSEHWYQPQKGGMLDPTARGALGLGLEVATDPLALAAEGVAKPIARASQSMGKPLTASEKLLQYGTRPIGQGLEDLGKKVYSSGFKKVDEVADKFNKLPASDVLFNYGVTGTNKSIANQSKNIVDNLRNKQAEILAKVDKSVPIVDMDQALQPLRDKIDNFKASKDPVKQEAAQALEEDLQTYQALKDKSVSPSELSGMKSSVQNSVPQKAYQSGVVQGNQYYTQGRKALGSGLRNETERSADLVAPEIGSSLRNTNAQMGSLLTTKNALDQEAMKGLNKNFITSVDPIVAALEHGTGMLPLKKAADLSKTTWFRTNAGRNLYNLGNYGDQLLRRPSAWQDLYNKYNQESPEEGQ